jgi:hypothetical protein
MIPLELLDKEQFKVKLADNGELIVRHKHYWCVSHSGVMLRSMSIDILSKDIDIMDFRRFVLLEYICIVKEGI